MLRAYRSTPHVTTAFTPHRLMFGQDPRTKLPEAVQEPHPDDQIVRENDRAAKRNIKSYADTKARAKPSLIDIGDVVLIRQRKTGKLSTPFHPRPLVVTSRKGSMVTARRQDGSLVTRNTSMFHRLPHEVAEDHPVIDDEDTEDETEKSGTPRTTISWARPRKDDTARHGRSTKKIGASQKTYTASAGTSVRRHM